MLHMEFVITVQLFADVKTLKAMVSEKRVLYFHYFNSIFAFMKEINTTVALYLL